MTQQEYHDYSKNTEFLDRENSERQRLLDDLAGKAMQSLLVDTGNSVFSESFRASVATAAYDIATAMMKERERRMKG